MAEKKSVYALLTDFLKGEGIDFFGALPFSKCKIINPRRLPEFEPKSVVVFLMPYYTGSFPERNVSLYSVSRDYHLFAEQLGEKLEKAVENKEFSCKLYADSSCIAEGELALKAGLGVIGENRLLINQVYGSYVFIGEILTDAVFSENEYTEVKTAGQCLSCGACKKACDFLKTGNGECLSALNQKKRLSDEELEIVKSKKIRWGCDVCQEVCPMNKNVKKTPIEFFYKEQIPVLTEKILEEMTEDEFKNRAYSWRGTGVIKRNLEE